MRGDFAWADEYAGRRGMSIRSFIVAIASHRAMVLYAAIAAVALTVTAAQDHALQHLAIAVAIAVVFYPFVEYGLHRFVLHAHFLWRAELTARIWRRLHYDHHMDPQDLTVLFAHPAASIPFLLAFSAIPSASMGDLELFPAMVFGSFSAFIYYETMHAAAHLEPRTGNRWLMHHGLCHRRHHYLDETAHFGISTDLVDRLSGRSVRSLSERGRSPTVRTLGYDGEMAARYPWVADGYARKRAAAAAKANVDSRVIG